MMGKLWLEEHIDKSLNKLLYRSIGMLLGYHLLWSTTANVVGTTEQQERMQKLIIENNYFVGGTLSA